MEFLLSEDQELFRRTVREFADREIAPVAAEYTRPEIDALPGGVARSRCGAASRGGAWSSGMRSARRSALNTALA